MSDNEMMQIGEITSIRLKDNPKYACIEISHGKREKKPSNMKNTLVVEYDNRPTTTVHTTADYAKSYELGQRVMIALAPAADMSEDEEY